MSFHDTVMWWLAGREPGNWWVILLSNRVPGT